MSLLRNICLLLLAAALGTAFNVRAQVTVEKPAIELTVEQEARLAELLPDLRCLVCQNESLAESRAPLALDLKYEVRSLVAQGKSATEIKHYLTDRYGDFVLFRPPFDPRTWLLWIGPFALVLLGLLVLVRQIRSTRRAAARAATTAKPADPAALKKLLDE
ncbi:cytochrome c-type biogenesis protein [Nevskia ramosa]|uniref:cytochrome c-type biogenesis protein n=1 Tax=Nevskia ramosa TaxID=64002 RepID=UPI0003B3408D|nr:cytochrome c-type biogenesis protein [Nevskia ramosa]